MGGTDEGDGFACTGESHRNTEPTGFETLVPKDMAVACPIEDFEPVGKAVDENEKGAVERILVEAVFNNGSEIFMAMVISPPTSIAFTTIIRLDRNHHHGSAK